MIERETVQNKDLLKDKITSSKIGTSISLISCWLIYCIIYSGYLKVLFPSLSRFFAVLQLVSIGLGGMFICVYLQKVRWRKTFFYPLLYVWIAFFMMCLCFFRTNNIENALSKIQSMLVTIVFMGVVFFLCEFLISRQVIEKLIDIIISANCCFLFLYVIVNISDIMMLIYAGLRMGNFDSNPIWIARMSGDTIILIVVKNYGRVHIRNIIQIIALFVLSFLLGSKGPLVATFISLFIFYQIVSNKNLSKRVLFFALGFIIVGTIVVLIANSQSSFIQNRFSLDSIMNPAPGYRLSRYIYSLKNIPKHIFIGHGLGNWAFDYWEQAAYIPSWATSQMRYKDYPHNLFLEILYDCGMISFIPMIMGIIALIRLRNKRENTLYYNAFYILCIANLLYSMFSGSVTEGNRGFYYIMALYCGLINANAISYQIGKG